METSAKAAEITASGRLEALYVEHAPAALRFAYYLSGDREQARDLVQDAFVPPGDSLISGGLTSSTPTKQNRSVPI